MKHNNKREDFIANDKSREFANIRATYYYGSACPMSFWDSLRRTDVYGDLQRIRDDGFNSVIFLLPVALVQIRKDSDELYQHFLSDLSYMIRMCRALNLRYLFRVFFTWDSYPGRIDKTTLLRNIFNQRAKGLYTAFLDDIWKVVKDDNYFIFAFTSWEDLTPQLISVTPNRPLDFRRKVADEIDLPIEIQEEEAVPVATSKKYPKYLEYMDQRFVSLHKDMSNHFPLLTSEIRIDITPISPKCSAGPLHWHHKQHAVGELIGVVGTYYAPYMGAPNNGDEMSAASATRNFLRSQEGFKSKAAFKPFVTQLIFVIGQEAYASFSRISTEQLPDLARGEIGKWLAEKSAGYATWSFKDYVLSAISNSSFHLPQMAGWNVAGEVHLLRQGLIKMAAGSSISQAKLTRKITRGIVLLEFVSIDNAELLLTFSDSIRAIRLDFRGKCLVSEKFMQDVRNLEADYFKIEVLSGSCVLKRALLGWDHHSNGGYSLNGDPGVMTPIWVDVNDLLADYSNPAGAGCELTTIHPKYPLHRVQVNYSIPPEELRWRVTSNRSESDFIASGQQSIDELALFLEEEAQTSLNSLPSILDVGCGCGRILRHLRGCAPDAGLCGSDIDEEAIRWCRDEMPDMKFYVASEFPPLDIEDDSFALTYAFSVFTHLDEKHQIAWLAELHRITQSGGLLALTYRDEDYVQGLPDGGIKNHIIRGLAQNGFYYMQNPRWQGTFPDWYGGAYHSSDYIQRIWGKYGKVVTLSPPRRAISQSIALLQKI